jgi:phage terminase large subunit-like protein
LQIKLKHERDLVSALHRLRQLELVAAFDPVDPTSRPTAAQQEIFDDIERIKHRYVIAGNQSGKSSLAAREIGWIVENNHPFWKRPERWGDEALLVLIAGQDRKQMEIELYTKKIKPFLTPGDWREVRVGGTLNFVEHRKKGHKIVFLSHNDSSDKNRQHMQGYVAHYVWLDEMPRDIKILEELTRRVDARNGYLLVTFTPKIKNEEIRKVIDSVQVPLAKRYRLSKLDNPLYADRLAEEEQKLAGYSESYRKTILYGDWYQGDSSVYEFNYERMNPFLLKRMAPRSFC